MKISDDSLNEFNASTYADIITQAVNKTGASTVVVSSSLDSKYLTPILSANIEAAYINNVISLPSNLDPFTVKRTAFTNKAFSDTSSNSEKVIVGLSNNSFGLIENSVSMDEEIFEVSNLVGKDDKGRKIRLQFPKIVDEMSDKYIKEKIEKSKKDKEKNKKKLPIIKK